MHHVIVGAGPAGVIAAETLRERDPDGEIMLIHGEDGEPYARMALPYYLSGMIDEAGTVLRKAKDFFRARRIDVVHGRVERLDPGERRLVLADGVTVPFDRLLLATGASAVRPPIEGLELPGVHACWTLDDARHIARRAEPGSHVVLLGAGFIGCIVLEALVERGVSLTVVEMGDRMVPRMLNATAGTMLKRWCESKGVTIHTSSRITRIETAPTAADERDTLAVDLDNGAQVPAHLVVIAAGVRANMAFLEGSGIATDQGILVDQHLQTNVPGIYAAGDVAQGPDFSTGGFSVHAVQPTAADHGRFAAINMSGGDAAYGGSLVMNVLDTLGLVSCSFGRWQGIDGGDQAERVDEAASRYVNLQFEDDRLVGAITLGRTDWVGMLRGLIQTRVPLGPWKGKLKADPHRVAEAYLARVGTA
ncbi:MAG: NAD(P)/FAD-dependent oxidoreductase [Rhodospirillales bacterium]|nr:NAD(P)/FAD-dependent oxidoreductase [Rhodospirillales bacterium]